MTNVIQGLKGDAVLVAQEIGMDKLNAEGDSLVSSGLELLIREMKAAVFPQTQNEAKDLFKVFMKAGGPLSRQLGESMQQYINRRRRAWALLKELDSTTEISEEQRADFLLDLAGLTHNERLMIKSSVGNARDFDKIAEALMCQHPEQHRREFRGPIKGRGKGNKGRGRGNLQARGKGWRPYGKGNRKGKMTANHADTTAYLAEDYD